MWYRRLGKPFFVATCQMSGRFVFLFCQFNMITVFIFCFLVPVLFPVKIHLVTGITAVISFWTMTREYIDARSIIFFTSCISTGSTVSMFIRMKFHHVFFWPNQTTQPRRKGLIGYFGLHWQVDRVFKLLQPGIQKKKTVVENTRFKQ